MSYKAKPPYQFFTDVDGTALDAGKIYVGVDGLDPEANPAAAFWDEALSTPAAQPIRTVSGLPDMSGTPSDFFTSTDYSITVRDKNDVLIHTKLSVSGRDGLGISDFAATLLDDTTAAEARRTLEIGGTGPYVILSTGQSNSQGANNGGPNPANSLVKTWDGATNAWGGSDYTQVPWTRSTPDGNGGNNNIALSRAHFIAETTGREVYIIHDATGGTSIDDWVATGTASPRWVGITAKMALALATPELSGVTEIDEVIWAQGEADYLDVFAEHLANLKTLRNQFRTEAWCNWETPIYMCAPSNQHDRYAPQNAISYMCSKVDNQCILVPTNGLRTHYDPQGDGSVIVSGQDYTHWLGGSLWELGYYRINKAFPFEAEPSLFHQSSVGPATPATTMAVSTFGSLFSWESRTGGAGLNETFSGDATTVAFTMIYRNTSVSTVTVGGVEMTDGTDYTVSGQVITFTTAPASGTSNIVVTYGVTVQAPPAFGSIGWGTACYPDGNNTYAFGWNVRTDNGSSYGLLAGNDLDTANGADFFGGFGWQNIISASKSFVSGQGHNVSDEGQAAVGLFSEYAAAETDAVLFQVGNGTTTSLRSNVLAARQSGTVEMKGLSVYATNADATAGGLSVGQVFQTPGGALRIVV